MEGQRGSNTNSMSNLGLIQGNKFEHKDSRLQCMITDKVYGQIVMKDKNKDERDVSSTRLSTDSG